MSESATQAPTHEVILTDVAAAKVKSLLEQEGRDDLRLRIAVQPGGCSGLIYQLYFDDRALDGDAIRSFDGVEVVVAEGEPGADRAGLGEVEDLVGGGTPTGQGE